MAPGPDPRAEAEAMIEDAAMEEAAAYLSRGRVFATANDEDVRRRWTTALKAWFVTRAPGDQQLMDDLAAELRLRGVEPPYETVSVELASMQDIIRRDGPYHPDILERVRKYQASRTKPPN